MLKRIWNLNRVWKFNRMLKSIAGIAAIFIITYLFFWQKQLHIAVITTSGNAGENNIVLRGIKTYVDEINAFGGILNHKIVIDKYEDTSSDSPENINSNKTNSNKTGSNKIYNKIDFLKKKLESDNYTIGILDTRLNANQQDTTLEKCDVPTISIMHSSTMLKNEFSMMDHGSESEYMTLYAKHIFKANNAVILYSSDELYTRLAENLSISCNQIQLPQIQLPAKDFYDTKDILNKSNKSLKPNKSLKHLQSIDKNAVILLAVNSADAQKVIKALRNKGINNKIICDRNIVDIYKNPDTNESSVGKFTEQGVYAVTPLLFDLSGESGESFIKEYKKAYGVSPTWNAAYGYDSAKLLLSGARRSINKNLINQKISLVRKGIIEYIDNLNQDITNIDLKNNNADEYVLDSLHFKNNQLETNIKLAICRPHGLVAADVQLTPVQHLYHLDDLDPILKKKLVVFEGNRAFYKTAIVHTGLNINSISGIKNEDSKACWLDFYMWFRFNPEYSNLDLTDLDVSKLDSSLDYNVLKESAERTVEKGLDIKQSDSKKSNSKHSQSKHSQSKHSSSCYSVYYPERIIFTNGVSIKDISVKKPYVANSNCSQNICCQKDDDSVYKIIYDENQAGQIYRLYHVKQLFRLDSFDVAQAKFYTKTHTLGVSFKHESADKNFIRYAKDPHGGGMSDQNFIDLKTTKKLFDSLKWDPYLVMSYEDVIGMSSMGDPKFLHYNKDVAYSSFNMRIELDESYWSIFDYIDYKLATNILFISLILSVIGSIWIVHNKRDTFIELLTFVPNAAVILAAQVMIMTKIMNHNIWIHYKKYFNIGFDIIWWMMIAYAVNLLISHIIWRRLEKYMDRPMPKLLTVSVQLIVYAFAVFAIVAFVLDRPITSLLASTSMVVFLIGLAIQMNISNIFSGIFMNIEGHLRVGDWVKFDDIEGWITEINWRSTGVLTDTGETHYIPNAKLSNLMVTNYNYPNNSHYFVMPVSVDLSHSPDTVLKILRESLHIHDRMTELIVRMSHFDDEMAQYNVIVKVEEFDGDIGYVLQDQVYRKIWQLLTQAGISPAPRMRRELFLHNVEKISSVDISSVIEQSKLLKDLSSKEKQTIIGSSYQIKIDANNKIILKDSTLKDSIGLSNNGVADYVDANYVAIIGSGDVMVSIPEQLLAAEGLFNKIDSNKYSDKQYIKLAPGTVIGLNDLIGKVSFEYETISSCILIMININTIKEIMTKNKDFESKVKNWLKYI